MTIGERIKDARKSKGLTQEDLARMLGVTFAMIGQYERGERNPKMETLQKIANALDISIMELLGQSENLGRWIKATANFTEEQWDRLIKVFSGATDHDIYNILFFGETWRNSSNRHPKGFNIRFADDTWDGVDSTNDK